jgi:hypothetical protein
MSAENQGTGAPEGDDPFGYLYRQEGGAADGATAAQQPGVPRRSYNQVRAVGERQYPQQAPQSYAGHGGQATAAFPQQDGSPSPHYAAPETMPGGRAASRQHGGGHGGGAGGTRRGGRGGSSHNGLLIGAIAVVAAVVVGIGAAVLFTNGGGDETAGGRNGTTAGPTAGEQSQDPQGKDEDSAGQEDQKVELPKADAVSLHLDGGTRVASDIPGASAKGGQYVAGINVAGASATWTTDVPEAGTYNLKVRYGVPGMDEHLSLGVNGKPHGTGLNMKNFAHAEKGDWEHGWTTTYATVTVDEGQNIFAISCRPGDKCDVNLDQIWLEPAKKG